jgi:hypothetical protein
MVTKIDEISGVPYFTINLGDRIIGTIRELDWRILPKDMLV